MLYPLASLLLLTAAPAASEVIDRIAVIVGSHVIKTSDISRELRVTAFLNRESPSFASDSRRKAAERLIDQTLIRDQIENGGYTKPSAADADALLKQILQDRFAGSATQMRQELRRYELAEEELPAQLLWQLTVLRFIDQRFRPGVLITDEEIRAYYDKNLPQLQREFPQNYAFEALEPKIRQSLEGERINRNFDQWLAEARKRVRIQYKQEAFS